MNPTAIYSKTGKGIHEASGKTSALPRGERAVLQAIDGRLTVAEVAKKAGKDFDAAFEALIVKMDKDGFIREASAGTATIPPKPAATVPPAAKKPAAPASGGGGGGAELDFTSFTAPPRPSAPPAGGTLDFSAKPDDRKAKEADAMKARMEAEAKAKADAAARARAEAEEKAKGESAAKARAAAEAQARAAAEAKAKAAREAQEHAAAEARKKADAEASARAEADRKARAEAAKETDDLKARLAEERKAREEAEHKAEEKAKAQAEALRAQIEGERKALEDERRKIAEDKKRREEEEKAERKRREEEEARRKREEEEARKRREEEERAERKRREEEERKRKEEEERAARKRREDEERRKKEEAERKRREEEEERKLRKEREEEEEKAKRRKREEAEEEERSSKKEKAAAKAEDKGGKGDDFGDSLLADLDSFTSREEDERKAKAEAEDKEKEAARKRREEEEARRKREDDERDAQRRKEEEKERKRDEERKSREEMEKRARDEEDRLKREEQKRKEEEEERKRKAKADESLAAQSVRQVPAGDSKADLERKRRQAMLAGAGAAARERRQSSWGKPVATVLFLLLVVGVGVLHVMPLNTAEYEKQASAAIGHPVKIDSARMSLYNGVRINLEKVRIGEAATIAAVHATPQIGTLLGDGPKAYTRLELEGLVMPQRLIADALFGAMQPDGMKVESVVAKQVKLEGPLALPQLDIDAAISSDGAVRTLSFNGPDGLLGRLTMKGSDGQVEVNASGFPILVAPDVALSNFSMSGTFNRSSMRVESWDGSILGGVFKGRANVRWGSNLTVQAESRFANINAAVFAPALLSDGRAEGNARFSLNGPPSNKLLAAGRVDGNFSIQKGSLGSFDLSRIIQTQGSQIGGRTQFTELTGQAIYDNGNVTVRNVALTAGALNAGASLEVTPEGRIAGRVVADVRTPAQTLRAQLTLSGTVKEPQVNR